MHEARHTYAALMIEAGVNMYALSTYMGHSSVKKTMDLYGHLLPGAEQEHARELATFLTGAQGGAQEQIPLYDAVLSATVQKRPS